MRIFNKGFTFPVDPLRVLVIFELTFVHYQHLACFVVDILCNPTHTLVCSSSDSQMKGGSCIFHQWQSLWRLSGKCQQRCYTLSHGNVVPTPTEY